MKSGILLLNKPTRISSSRVLTPLKRTFSGRRIGHTGTLDPFADGLLVVLVGTATKMSRWFLKLDKRYEAEIALGAETDTLDTEGRIVAEAPVPSFETIRLAAEQYHGTIMQIPPSYSALKIEGQRAYQRARRGEAVEIPARPVEIYELSIAPGKDGDHVMLATHCGSGTYIRALVRDIATSAGTRGYCTALKRTWVGPFSLEDAVTPDEITTADNPETYLVSIPDAVRRLGIMPVLPADSESVRHLRNGKPIGHRVAELSLADNRDGETLIIDGESGAAVAIVDHSNDEWSYCVVFPEGTS